MVGHLGVTIADGKWNVSLPGCIILEDLLFVTSTMLNTFSICYSSVVQLFFLGNFEMDSTKKGGIS